MTAFLKIKTSRDVQLININAISRILPDAHDATKCYIYLGTGQSDTYNCVHAFASMDEIILAIKTCGCCIQ